MMYFIRFVQSFAFAVYHLQRVYKKVIEYLLGLKLIIITATIDDGLLYEIWKRGRRKKSLWDFFLHAHIIIQNELIGLSFLTL